jgi:hypothetical protein
MMAIGDTKKMIMGGWILAALIVLAYNGSQFASLLAPPVTGYSHEVRSVIGKRHQMDAQIAAAKQSMTPLDLTWLATGVDRPPDKKEAENTEPAPPLASAADAPVTKEEMQLPRLQGIFQTSDIQGHLKRRAVLDGNLFKEKDRIGNFTVQQISDKGVLLTNDRGRWFLQPPDVPFSFAREE